MWKAIDKEQLFNFNIDVFEVCEESETALHEEGYYSVSFIFAADPVTSITSLLRTMLLRFLLGNKSYLAHTDTNHKMKNDRYQYVIGGNITKE